MAAVRKIAEETDQRWRVFAASYVALGGRATEAAAAAGYEQPRTEGHRLLRNTKVQTMIEREQVIQVKGAAVSEALACLRGIITDEAAPHSARVEASKTVLNVSGFGDKVRELTDKPLNERSIEELDEIIKQGQEAITLLESAADDVQQAEGDEITVEPLEEE